MLANMGQQRRKKGDGGLYQATVHAHGGEYRYWMADWVDELYPTRVGMNLGLASPPYFLVILIYPT